MKKMWLFVLTLLFTTSAFALNYRDVSGAGFDDLSDTDKMAVMQDITNRKAATPPAAKILPAIEAKVPTVDQVDKWVTLGGNIGKGLGAAAKEIGVAGNDFVQTPVGQWTAFLIIWNFIGSAAAHIIGGLIILILGSAGIVAFARMSVEVETKYDPEKVDIFGRSRLVSKTRGAMSDGDQPEVILLSIALIILWCSITFTW